MFEKVITQVLNKVLGKFIENIDPSQLKISVVSGKVKLENMKLKPSIFESLPVPFQLVQGQVGLINLKIPVLKLTSSPLIIEISDVFALIRPKHIKEWNIDVEEKSFLASTQEKLEQYEIIEQQTESLKKSDPSSVDKLVQKIIDNIQVKIKNVYLRYEDSYSAPNYGDGKFVVGIMLRELSLATSDPEWNFKGIISGSDITHKVAKITSLTIFMDFNSEVVNNTSDEAKDSRNSMLTSMTAFDELSIHGNRELFLEVLEKQFVKAQDKNSHQFILDRFSLEGRIAFNKNPLENRLPQIEMNLLLGGTFQQIQQPEQGEKVSINLTIHQPQIIRILKLVEYIGYYNEFQRGALLQYYNYPVSQTAANDYIQMYIEWRGLIAFKGKKKEEAKAKKLQLKELEDKSTYDKIIVLRQFANKLLEQQFNKKKEEEIIEQKVQEKSKEKRGVWGFFASKAKKEQDKNELEEFREKLQKEFDMQEEAKKQHLYDELSSLTDDLGQTALVTNEDFDKLPGDYIRFSFMFRVPSLKLGFLNEFEQNIFEAEIEEIVTDVRVGQTFQKIEVYLLELTIQDQWTGAKAFPNILETKELSTEGLVVQEDATSKHLKKQVLIVKFESNKEFKICPFKIFVETQKTVFIVANMHLIKEVQRSILAAVKGETLDFSFFKEAATETALKYMEQGKSILDAVKSGKYEHSALDLTLFLTAPTILVPQNLFEPKKPCLVLDIGTLELKSFLVPSEPFVDYKLIKSASSLYDRYEASLKSLQINILEDGLKGVSNYQKGEGISLIKDFNATLFFFNCVESMHPFFPTAELSVIIQNIELSFGLVAVKTIMKIINAIDDGISTKEQDIFNQIVADAGNTERKSLLQQNIAVDIGKSMIYEVRKKAEQRKELLGIGQAASNEEEQQMFQHLQHAIQSDDIDVLTDDTDGSFIDKVINQEEEEKNKLGTSFKVFFTVERLQIALQGEYVLNVNRDTHLNSLLCIMLDHFSVEVELDRRQDVTVNVVVFKFIIEDTQMENPIAQQFRMILSSPIVEQIRQSNADDSDEGNHPHKAESEEFKSSSYKDLERIKNNAQLIKKNSSFAKKSLLSFQEAEDYDIFQDALETQEGQGVNEWELKLFNSKDLLDIKITLSDLTLIFALPTITKIVEIVLKIERIFSDLEQERIADFIKRLHLYEFVLENIGKDSFDDHENLLKKIFSNQFKLRKIDQSNGLVKYTDGVRKLQQIWERQDEVYSSEQMPTRQSILEEVSEHEHEQSMSESQSEDGFVSAQFKKNTRIEENKTKISIQAKLNNFSVWLPLNAQDPTSQILSLSFISELHYESQTFVRQEFENTFGTKIKSENIDSKDQLSFSINHFVIEMLTQYQKNDLLARGEFDKYIANENYCTTKMLTPCRISLSYDSYNKDDEQLFKNNISISIEPMHLKVGFKDIDFINIIYVKVDSDILKQFRQREEELESQSSSSAAVQSIQGYQLGSEKSYDAFLDNQFSKLRQNSQFEAKRKTAVKKQPKKKKGKKGKPVKPRTTWTTLKVECEALTVSLDDDSEQIDHPLLYCTVQQASLQMKSYDKKDEPAIYILKKMGIFQKRHPQETKDQTFRDLKAFAKFTVNYYNQRSLAFEPLIEPWYLLAHINQEAAHTVQNIHVESEHMLNINLTFGMALTVRRIMDRLEESLKQAKQVHKELQKQELMNSEIDSMPASIRSPLKAYKVKDQRERENQLGFIFANYTGLDMMFNVHDEEKNTNETYKKYSKTVEKRGIVVSEEYKAPNKENIFKVKGENNDTIFKTFDELYALLSEINIRNNKGKIVESIEEDPLLLDVKINGVDMVASIPIEGLGVYSFIATIEVQSDLSPESLASKSSANQSKKEKKNVGVICNIKMDGVHKKVSIESQLLIANNLSREVVLYCSDSMTMKQGEHQYQVNLAPGQVFRAPITWLVLANPLHLYIQTLNNQPELIIKNLEKCFTPKHVDSKLTQQSSQVIKLQEEFFTSMNISGYFCQQARPEDYPLQYLMSFDPPLRVINYNFRPLEIKEAKTQELLTLMAPKETAFITNIDTINTKPSLQWTFYETALSTFTCVTNNFTLSSRLDTINTENFTGGNNSVKEDHQKVQQLELEVQKAFYQELKDYEENFDQRVRKVDYISSASVMVYPKYMIVNKTNVPLTCDGKTIAPMTTDYFNTNQKKVKIKTQGYKSSSAFDITTTGVSGKLELNLNKAQDVFSDKLKQNYIPQKLEFGLQIKRAPNPFSKTIIVTIEPRFIIINQLKKPIVIKQKGQKEQVVVLGQQQAYNFQDKNNQEIMFRQAKEEEITAYSQKKPLSDEMAKDELAFWSAPFSIENLEDFQVCFPAQKVEVDNQQQQWFLPNNQNNFNRFVRVIITTQDDATILVVLTDPFIPEYEIQNRTEFEVQYAQIDDNQNDKLVHKAKRVIRSEDYIVGKFRKISPRQEIAYAWADRTPPVKKLIVKIGQKVEVLNLDKAMKKKEIVINKTQKFNIEVRVAGNIKRVKITAINEEKEKNNQAMYFQHLIKRYQGQKLNIVVNLKGIGLSFVDDQPRELLYLSLYKIRFGMQNWIETRMDGSGLMESITKFRLELDHLQLDNMINQIMPVVIAPIRPLLNKDTHGKEITGLMPMQHQPIEEQKDQKSNEFALVTQKDIEDTPFIQLNVSLAETIGQSSELGKVTRIRGFQCAIQEFMIQVETTIINNNFKFVEAIYKIFVDEKKFKQKSANVENFEKYQNIQKEEVCTELDANRGAVTDESMIHSNKIFIEFVHLGAIKVNLTFQLEKKAFEFDITDPRKGFGASGILYSVAAGAASITDSSLRFKELILIDTFITTDMLINQIGKNYARQGVLQFYKLIGSSDMIGNPLGLVDKLGTGVFEFFSEPKKGLLQGPEEFVGGVGKGVKSLVTNVVSGSMDSVSKITGSLYTVIKNVSGEENVKIQKSEHVFDGLYKGVKGGMGELIGGVTGLVTKPIQKTKQEGAKGFFKGIGSGLMGAITAPITATLKLGSSVTDGVANTAIAINNIGRGAEINVKYVRFRPPRFINTKHIIQPYSEDISLVNQFLNQLRHGRYARQQIRYFAVLPETTRQGALVSPGINDGSILIITDKVVLYLRVFNEGVKRGKAELLFKVKLKRIKRCEVLRAQNQQQQQVPDNTYYLVLHTQSIAKGERKYIFQSREYIKFEKIYNLISVIPECEGIDNVRMVSEKPTRLAIN